MCRYSPGVIHFLSEIHQLLSLFLSLSCCFSSDGVSGPPRPHRRFTSSPLWEIVTSPHLVSSLWCERARWLSTHLMWPCPLSQSAWDPASRAPASTWRALCGKKLRTVRKYTVVRACDISWGYMVSRQTFDWTYGKVRLIATAVKRKRQSDWRVKWPSQFVLITPQ